MGLDHHAWKGDDAKYSSLHTRVWIRKGKAAECLWGCKSGSFEWANLTDEYANIDDYAQMCSSCHRAYDHARRSMGSDFTGPRHTRVSEAAIAKIYQLKSMGISQCSIARELRVNQSTVSRIVNGQRRKGVR
jgi:hypothetical protein